ncbi:hypothetical protein Tco_0308236 [Tanacetum coccineum]
MAILFLSYLLGLRHPYVVTVDFPRATINSLLLFSHFYLFIFYPHRSISSPSLQGPVACRCIPFLKVDLVKTYLIPLDLHHRLPDPGLTMDHLPGDTIGIYSEFLWFFGVRIPFSTFLLSVLKYFKVHISQLVPLGDWFSFSKRHDTEDVCMDDGPSSLKKWKDKFFLIYGRAIPDYLTWRHSCSCVSNDLPTDGYDRNDVERLCARLICLCEMREEVLVLSGLSSVWFNKECDQVFPKIDDNAGRMGVIISIHYLLFLLLCAGRCFAFYVKMSIYDFMTLPSWGDAKVAEESHHLSSSLLERVPSHTTASAAEGAMISLPTPYEIVASLSDPRLAKKSKGPSQVRVHSASNTPPKPSRPSKKRKLKKRASEAGSSAPELGQAKGMNEADLTNFCAEIENSLERDEGTSTRPALALTPCLGKRLGAPPSMVVVSVSRPSHVGTLVYASTSGCSFSLGVAYGLLSAAVSGHAGKSGAEVVRRQMNPLDSLARSALSRDVEYDQISEDDFGTATRGEEIDLTLFPFTPGPYQMSYPYEGDSSPPYTKEKWNGPHAPEDNILCKDIFKDPDVCRKALDRTLTPAKLKRIESLLLLDLSNPRNCLQEKFDRKVGYVKVLRSEVTTLDGKLERIHKDCDALGQENRELRSQKDDAYDKVKELQTELTDARVASIGLSKELSKTDAMLSDQALVVRDLQNHLALEKAKSQGYKDVVDGLREEVTRFVGSGVESLVRKLLSSDKFHASLAHVASLGINYGVERGLRIGCTDAEFEVVAQKVSNFYIGTLLEVTQVLPDKHIHSVTSIPVAPPIANEDVNQVPLEHASDDSAASI